MSLPTQNVVRRAQYGIIAGGSAAVSRIRAGPVHKIWVKGAGLGQPCQRSSAPVGASSEVVRISRSPVHTPAFRSGLLKLASHLGPLRGHPAVCLPDPRFLCSVSAPRAFHGFGSVLLGSSLDRIGSSDLR